MGLKEFYLSIEDKYYGLMERIGLTNLFVAPIESRGIPSLPVAILLLLLLTVGAYYSVAGAMPGSQEFTIKVYGDDVKLDGATVQLLDSEGNVLKEAETAAGLASFNLPAGVFTLRVKKTGFQDYEAEIDTREKAVFSAKLYSGQGIIIPTPTPAPSEWASTTPEAESNTGSLNIIVRDNQGKPASGVAKVYNAESSVLIKSVAVQGGSAVVANIEVDTEVFANFDGTGYYPYSGDDNLKTIQPGQNSYLINVQLVQNASGNASANQSLVETIIQVKDSNGAYLAGASVNVYERGSLTPVSADLVTGNNGEVVLALPGDQDYYASADKAGYFRGYSGIFQGADAVTITLSDYAEGESAALNITIIDEETGVPMAGAGVALFTIVSGEFRPLADTKTTGLNGAALFEGLPRNLNVLISASKGSRSANVTVLTPSTQDTLSVQLLIPLNPAYVIANASNILTGAPLAASFQAVYGASVLDSCTAAAGASCVLEIAARRDVQLRAVAPGYELRETFVNLPAESEYHWTAELLESSVMNDSFVEFDGFYTVPGGQKTESLMLGHEYDARFWLVTDNASLSGLFFKVADEDAQEAWLTGVMPPAAIVKANYVPGPEFADAKCNYSSPCNWMEAQYAGSQNRIVSFRVQIDPNIEVDAKTHKASASFSYRSWAALDEFTLIRNPWDEVLEDQIDSMLPSGYYSATYDFTADIYSPGTTCTEGVCVSLSFAQGEQIGPNEGFSATSLLNLAPGDAEWEPLLVSYSIELFRNLGTESSFSFAYWPENFELDYGDVQVESYSEDVLELVCGTSIVTPLDFAYSADFEGKQVASVSLSSILKCTDYAPYSLTGESFKIKGTLYLKPLGSAPETFVKAAFSTKRTPVNESIELPPQVTGTHETWLSVDNPSGAYTPYGYVEMTLEQRNNEQEQTAEPWEAVSILDCTDAEIQDESCHHGLVKAVIAYTAQRARDDNEILLETIPAHLKVLSASYEKDGETVYPQLYEQGFHANVGHMEVGEVVTATAWLKPIGSDVYSAVTAQHKSADPGEADAQHVTRLERNVFVSSIPSQRESEFASFAGLDGDCGGSVHVTFDPRLTGSSAFHLQTGCTKLALMVTPIFPADAVPTFVSTGGQTLLASIEEDDGSSGCYESCSAEGVNCVQGFDALTADGERILRYNTELSSCPDEFRLAGNRIKSSSVLLKLAPVGSEYTETLNLSVNGNPLGAECFAAWLDNAADAQTCLEKYPSLENEPRYRYKSFYVGPVIKSYAFEPSPTGEQASSNLEASFSGMPFHPEVWALVNHKQAGERTFIVVEASGVTQADPSANYDSIYPFNGLNPHFYAEFDGPGVKTFAYYPQSGKRLIIYEKLGNAVPVFVYDPCDSNEWESVAGCTRQTSFASTYNNLFLTDATPEYAEIYDEFTSQSASTTESYFASPINLEGFKPYSWPVLQAAIEKGRQAANWTSFWRSNSVEYWCDSDTLMSDPFNESQCRFTLDDWRSIDASNITQKHACTFCNNTNNAACGVESEEQLACTYNNSIPSVDCDDRCFATGESLGSAFVSYGESFVANFSQCTTLLTATKTYDGSTPLTTISKAEATACFTNAGIPGCPLDFVAGTSAANPQPLCFFDGNYDGFRGGETDLVPATAQSNGWTCTGGMVLSVRRQYCNREGRECSLSLGSEKYAQKLTTIDAADVDACFANEGAYCPLELDDLGKPYCYLEYSGDSFYDAQADAGPLGEPVVVPSVAKTDYYECPMEGQPAKQSYVLVHSVCLASCDSYCFPRNDCDLTCGIDGFTETFAFEYNTQISWDTVTGASDALVSKQFAYLPEDEEYANANLQPMRSFPEYGVNFRYNLVVNKFFGAEPDFPYPEFLSFYGDPNYEVALRVSEVTGCTVNDDEKYAAYDEQGVYGVEILNTPDVGTGQDLWLGTASVLSLEKTEYLGIQCRKPDAAWGSVELCGPSYTDYSATYGSCVNTLYQHDPALLALFKDKGYLGRFTTGANREYSSEGCVISDAGYIACLSKSEKKDQSGTVDGWRQEFAFSTPTGEYSMKAKEWPTPVWKTAAMYAYYGVQAASIISTAGGALGIAPGLMKTIGTVGNLGISPTAFGGTLGAKMGVGAVRGALKAGIGYASTYEQCWGDGIAVVSAGAAIGAGEAALASLVEPNTETVSTTYGESTTTDIEPGASGGSTDLTVFNSGDTQPAYVSTNPIGYSKGDLWALTGTRAATSFLEWQAFRGVPGGSGGLIDLGGCSECYQPESVGPANFLDKVWGCNEKESAVWWIRASNAGEPN
ncbi:MAG: hypothetical protein WC607_02915 [Candidatus Micrarchaeia archaeon]